MSKPDLLFGHASMGASFIQKRDMLELINQLLVSPKPIQPLDILLYRQAFPETARVEPSSKNMASPLDNYFVQR